MANWTQEDGSTKPVTNPTDVSTIAQTSDANGAVRDAVPVPCLIPSFADAVKLLNARYSCLVLHTHRRHVVLPPVYLRKKRTGIQEELNAELLKFSSRLKGVPMAYDSIKVVGPHGDIYDDQGFVHLNIEASFVVFKPKKGSKLVGVINKLGVGHVGCLVHGCFNAAVVKPGLLTSDQWRDSGLCVGQSLQFEVFQLDADAAGVVLIRGRLEKSRVQELVAQTEQNQPTVESTPEPEATEDTSGTSKLKKKKKKDKREKEHEHDDTVNDGNPEPQATENLQNTADTMELDCNSNGHHKEKKKKKKKKDKRDEIAPTSDSSGYVSDKTSRKREAESQNDAEMPPSKKKKKSK